MRRFAETGEAVGATSSKKEKVRLVSEYLKTLAIDDAARAAVFFCGRAFPRCEERVLAAGGAMIWEVVTHLADATRGDMHVAYRKHGDLGAMAEELLASVAVAGTLSLADAAAAFEKLAATRFPAAK